MARNNAPSALLCEQTYNDMRDSLPSSTKKQSSPFLNFEAELRNEIYRLVLVSKPIVVEIADAPPVDHPLLKTCRQIRTEARGIYLRESKLIFAVRNLDIRKVVVWLDRSPAHPDVHSMYANAQLALTATPKDRSSWAFLRYWAFLYRAGRCPRLTSASFNARSDATHYLPARDQLQAISLFDVAESHLMSDLNTFSAALERYREDFMAPHENNHRIWWGCSFTPEFPPPLPLPPRTVYGPDRVRPEVSPPMDWNQFWP
jgi:hypothetical protein